MPSLADLLAAGDRYKIIKAKGGCHTCPLKLIDYVPATLTDASVILVGEGPGQKEAEEGEGFVGQSGQLLRGELALASIDRFALTNMVHCRPPKNRNPTAREMQACLNQYVLNEVSGYPFVVLVGSAAMAAFFPHYKSKNLRGNLAYHPDFPGQRFYGLRHPAHVLRTGGMYQQEFSQHVGRLGRILRGESEARITVHRPGGNPHHWLAHLKAEFERHAMVSYDAETFGVETWAEDFRMRSFAVAMSESETFFVNETDAVWLDALDMLSQKMHHTDTIIVGHNVGFDIIGLERAAKRPVRARVVMDTDVAYYLLRGWSQSALKELTSRVADGYRHIVTQPHIESDMTLLGLYNSEDVVYPLRMNNAALREMSPKLRDLYMRVCGPSAPLLKRMSHHGWNFDLELWQQKKVELEARRDRIFEDWKAEDPHFADIPKRDKRDNDRLKISRKASEEYVLTRHGLPIVKMTPGGDQASFDADALNTWINQHGATYLKHWLDLRSVDKEIDTYVDPYADLVREDGLVHPAFHNTRTKSGRTSSSNPNSQNLKRGRGGPRQLFIARPGWQLTSADLSQIELRVGFSLANEEAGLSAYQRGEDLHMETARMLAQISGWDWASLSKERQKELRTHAKATNFALLFGGSGGTLQEYARKAYGVEFSDSEANNIVRWYFIKYPMLTPWHQRTIASFYANRGWMESVLGFIRFWPEWDSPDYELRGHAERSSLNMTVQGPAAHICIYIALRLQWSLADAGAETIVIGTVHDSVVTDGPPDEQALVMEHVQAAVESAYGWVRPWLKTPLVMEVEVGERLDRLEEVGVSSAGLAKVA